MNCRPARALLTALFSFCLWCLPCDLSASRFDTAGLQPPGKLLLVIHPDFEPQLDRFMLYADLNIGIVPGLDIAGRFGFNRSDQFYGGLDLEVGVIPDKGWQPAISLAGGVHWQSTWGFDGTVLIGKNFVPVEPYLGCTVEVEVSDGWNGSMTEVFGLLGLRVSLYPRVSWFLEGGADFRHLKRGAHYIGTGIGVHLL